MTIAELMAGKEVNASYEGLLTVDDYVLAIDTDPTGEDPTADTAYAVLQKGITGYPGNLNPEQVTRQFIRTGQQTMVTSKQFTLTVSGTRYVGDPAQDYILDFGRIFATGQDLVTNYIFFDIKTGKGWKGKCTISLSTIADGEAGDDATFSCDLAGTEVNPSEWDYTTASADTYSVGKAQVGSAEVQ